MEKGWNWWFHFEFLACLIFLLESLNIMKLFQIVLYSWFYDRVQWIGEELESYKVLFQFLKESWCEFSCRCEVPRKLLWSPIRIFPMSFIWLFFLSQIICQMKFKRLSHFSWQKLQRFFVNEYLLYFLSLICYLQDHHDKSN